MCYDEHTYTFCCDTNIPVGFFLLAEKYTSKQSVMCYDEYTYSLTLLGFLQQLSRVWKAVLAFVLSLALSTVISRCILRQCLLQSCLAPMIYETTAQYQVALLGQLHK